MSFSQVPVKPILAGGLSALLLISAPFLLPFSILYSNLVQLPLLYVGLGIGFRDGVIATLTASVILLIGGTGLHSLVSFLFLNGLPALLILFFALKYVKQNKTVYWYPPGRILSNLLLYAIGVSGITAYLIYGLELFDRVSEAFGLLIGPADSPEQELAIKAFAVFFKTYAPALIGVSFFLVTTLNAILAQAILAKMGQNLRPSPKMQEILFPWWLWYTSVASALFGFAFSEHWAGLLCLNLFYLTLVGFFFEGLSVLHAFARRAGENKLFLWIMYFVLALLIGLVVIVIAIGIFEPWLRLRERLKNQ